MCNINDEEKLKALPIMLKNDELDFFDEYNDTCRTFEDTLKLLRDWCSSDYGISRILTE